MLGRTFFWFGEIAAQNLAGTRETFVTLLLSSLSPSHGSPGRRPLSQALKAIHSRSIIRDMGKGSASGIVGW